MDLVRLRRLLWPLVLGLKDVVTHAELPSILEELGLPISDSLGSKKERLDASFDALGDSDLPEVAQRFLSLRSPDAATRNRIQDILWSSGGYPEIPKRFRREVARAIQAEGLYEDVRQFDALLDRLWVLDTDQVAALWGGRDAGLRAEIEQHVYRNPDWSAEILFDQLGAYESSDHRFILFLEGLASADVRPDEPAQRRFVACVNIAVKGCGVELRESGIDGGYPVFTIVSLRSATKGGPKNLIFASAEKPDLRFRDALDNDIEIVTNADKVLVYDRPIGPEGLRWRDLQLWWSDTKGILDANDAKVSLYRRLRESLPSSSPPQTVLFDAFYSGFGGAVPELPTLLPEVWLHWDPLTARERGKDALLRFRMDFLLLLPQGFRIVIEVDGKLHYADAKGVADVQRYADMARADRDLKLAGYEVFRFGAAELQRPAAKAEVKNFFLALFKRYRVLA